ncbi:uncharacterized protein LOC130995214 isoform X3 [Salvia miltiorrhiza]|uniref:uncharacterized protein LOC130995214 isoform X3 n=1 Tax=Salvia miltiorrhiza TaxID=226208 RepID=UPI0025AC71F8|nr:uncharacterized protein LOC130995214 isoform X3 [Salvia miltiorrhiza]
MLVFHGLNVYVKLLVDRGAQKGHTLDVVIFHDNIVRFKHVLQEGNVYMVKGAYVSDPKQYKNPIVTCNYQWTFRKDTLVNEEPNDSIPAGGLSFRTTPSYTTCVIIGTHEPREATVQGKVIREYAAIDTELETFVVTFWKQENEEAINMLVQTGGFFEKKVLRSPKQPLQITKVEQMLHKKEMMLIDLRILMVHIWICLYQMNLWREQLIANLLKILIWSHVYLWQAKESHKHQHSSQRVAEQSSEEYWTNEVKDFMRL